MNLKKHIPNTLTCCNLLSGCAATYFAFQQDFPLSMLLIVVGAAFDFFDGFAARLLHVSSPIGKELDSLADDITFGFAPAAMVFAMLQQLVSPSISARGVSAATESTTTTSTAPEPSFPPAKRRALRRRCPL